MTSARLAVDIGGTFTDLALEQRGRRCHAKLLTTPAAPEQGVLTGVAPSSARPGWRRGDIGLVVHGTTLATNAIIERKGARTALVTTQGFRDVLAIGNESRYDQYDLQIGLPEPLVPRYLRCRCRSGWTPTAACCCRWTRRRCARWSRRCARTASSPSRSASCTPTSTRRTSSARGAILAEALPGVPSACPPTCRREMREWERFSTTAANAYVQPLMAGLPAPAGGRAARRWAAGAAVPDAVRRRADHGGDRLPLPDPPGGERAGRRRDLRRRHRPRSGLDRVLSLRHGRHHGQDLPDRRLRAADRAHVRGRPRRPLQEGVAACRCASR